MKKHIIRTTVYAVTLLASIFVTGCQTGSGKAGNGLAGAWHGKVSGTSGLLASMKGIEFMYVFNADGTMTESSNYDSYPPGPPAYGVWRKVGTGQYEAKYLVFLTKPVAILDEIAKGGGWLPNGHGVLTQKITLSQDGNGFESTIKFDLFDLDGKTVEGGGDGTAQGERIKF